MTKVKLEGKKTPKLMLQVSRRTNARKKASGMSGYEIVMGYEYDERIQYTYMKML